MTATAPTIHTTVGELVAQRPSRSRVFEQLGIDYCCGGKKPLAELCAARGLDADTVLTVLLAAEAGSAEQATDWTQAPLADLADHIEHTHHQYLREELPRLGRMVHKVASVHGDRFGWMRDIARIFNAFSKELYMHMDKEEQVLFPMIRSLEHDGQVTDSPCGHGIDAPIQVMEHEHDDAGRALEEMRKLSSDYTPPGDACNTFRATLDGLAQLEADMHQHVHKENNILFPRALKMPQKTSNAA